MNSAPHPVDHEAQRKIRLTDKETDILRYLARQAAGRAA
jgi:hypothetical protein